MSKALDIENFLELAAGELLIDVRSPKEYNQGHIPGAFNLPLFSDEERAVVGTLYKQKGRNPAIEAGLGMVGPKMQGFLQTVKPLVRSNRIFVHCWRGGMRSGSMAWLFDMMGYEVYTLVKGYKAYRNHVLTILGQSVSYIIVGGRTGSGKTELLMHLKQSGEQVIDLERLANHKGSAFGALGEPPQPSTEQFENNLLQELLALDLSKVVWLEDESKNIGRCYIPNTMWEQMLRSPVLVVDMPLDLRVQRLLHDYAAQGKEGLRYSIEKIGKRLGNEAMKKALLALDEGNFEEVARLSLHYYDKAYDHALQGKAARIKDRMECPDGNLKLLAEKMTAFSKLL